MADRPSENPGCDRDEPSGLSKSSARRARGRRPFRFLGLGAIERLGSLSYGLIPLNLPESVIGEIESMGFVWPDPPAADRCCAGPRNDRPRDETSGVGTSECVALAKSRHRHVVGLEEI